MMMTLGDSTALPLACVYVHPYLVGAPCTVCVCVCVCLFCVCDLCVHASHLYAVCWCSSVLLQALLDDVQYSSFKL